MAISSTVMAEEYDYNYDTTGAEIAFLGLAGALCIIPIVIFVLWIILAIWVYKDAKKRDSSGALWLLIVLITGIIGLIIWLVVRPPIGGDKKEPNRRCPNCGRAIPEDAKTCPYCSKKFE
jgi:Na+/H+-dicarboxylate symporter